jgi:hypothetical protein
VHRRTDRTARIGDVTAPELTTLRCPWHRRGITLNVLIN